MSIQHLLTSEVIVLNENGSYSCKCGSTLMKNSIYNHLKTKKHLLICKEKKKEDERKEDEKKEEKKKEEKKKEEKKKECSICYEDKMEFFTCSTCKNIHCMDCNKSIISRNGKCPFCRSRFNFPPSRNQNNFPPSRIRRHRFPPVRYTPTEQFVRDVRSSLHWINRYFINTQSPHYPFLSYDRRLLEEELGRLGRLLNNNIHLVFRLNLEFIDLRHSIYNIIYPIDNIASNAIIDFLYLHH